ncbi:hypothetical protein HAX54_029162, partial [Datura stramonium]|nr:hypothetical protein [Datura stramonium]
SGKVTVDPPRSVVTDEIVEPVVIDDNKVADSKEQILVEDYCCCPQVYGSYK